MRPPLRLDEVSYVGLRALGLAAARVARTLGVSPQSVLRGATVLAAQGPDPESLRARQ